jgi:hypothetical protein
MWRRQDSTLHPSGTSCLIGLDLGGLGAQSSCHNISQLHAHMGVGVRLPGMSMHHVYCWCDNHAHLRQSRSPARVPLDRASTSLLCSFVVLLDDPYYLLHVSYQLTSTPDYHEQLASLRYVASFDLSVTFSAAAS